MENVVEQLKQVDFLDIYDEIVEIPITNEQVARMCITMPCKVDLRMGNLVYLVEQKYKAQLSTYKKSKVLKWLTVNLPRLLPNPEAKYLRWHERHQRRVKIDWIQRKAQAIQPLPPPISLTPPSGLQEKDASRVSLLRKSQTNEIDSSTPHSNSTAATLETVIPSQPKSPQDIMSGFLDLMDASITTVDSDELPTPFINTVTSTQEFDLEPRSNKDRHRIEETENPMQKKIHPRRVALQQSDAFSSQELYNSFNIDNMVTSTQEFG
ncbi:uncharacterized protein LOC129950877 [Eupeodes corollae]|uniref:uncharacterized protein LOC129950877 n=1 Tax=Eupeodes corollae TaxID=290404 RepID=UPI00249056B9|nr:uncharacterized protein LOC129950877 [Eupeodes corollae]